jgi:hypothetical protein
MARSDLISRALQNIKHTPNVVVFSFGTEKSRVCQHTEAELFAAAAASYSYLLQFLACVHQFFQ